MNKVNFLITVYSWVDDTDKILNVENDPYFTLVNIKTGQSYKTIYTGKTMGILSFVYYNPDSKEMDNIFINPSDILSENYEFYKNGRRFYLTNAINISKELNFSSLKAGKAYRIKQVTIAQDVIYVGSTPEKLIFARYSSMLHGVREVYLDKEKFIEEYELYEFEN